MAGAPRSDLGDTLRLLRARGFSPAGQAGGARSFEGHLACKGGAIAVRLSISDWDFVAYPAITVLDRLDALPPLSPHVFGDGSLCYFAKGSVVLDRYDPAGSIAQCLDQARHVLERIRRNPTYRHDDVQDEFLQHWANAPGTVYPVLVGNVDRLASHSNYWFVDVAGEKHAVIATEATEVSALAAALSLEPPKESRCPCWLFSTDVLPAVPESMPKTIKQLFAWLKTWDETLYRGLHRVLDREPRYLQFSIASFAVRTPLGWLGFTFDLDPIHRRGAAKNPSLYRQFLHTRDGGRPIARLAVTEFGSDFVHSRNLTFPDLKNKRLTVVGCGAIGSFIGPALVRLGAGTGSGRLDLVDPELLGTENVGRHSLGYPSLFRHKATELAADSVRLFPFANIRPLVKDVREIRDLFDVDLVIDATGEEVLSELLNAMRLDSQAMTPMLHVRIRGNGEAVQTFWTEGKKLGCFRCLMQADDAEYRKERFPLLKTIPERKQLGCAGFTPYAVSEPMSAAALAMEVIVDWLQNGTATPRFRTRATANADVYDVKDQDVKRLVSCVACGTHDAQTLAVRS